MDEYLIYIWNDTVGENDIVYNLGDVSFHKDSKKTEKILKRLNGYHRLILGNHDKQIIKETFLQNCFDEICEYKFFKNSEFKKGCVFNACYDYNGRFLELCEVIKKAQNMDYSGFIHSE